MKKSLLIGLMLFCSACGKFGPPVPPEAVAPEAVKTLVATAGTDGVAFSWEAPENDQRGKELKQIDGYWVYRKTISKDSDVVDPDVEYEKIGQVSDTHIVVRDDLRKKAEAEGKIVRKVKVDPSLTKFSFNDSALTPGGNYLYKIVPINQDDEAGGIKKYVRVRFQGDASVVTIFDAKDIAEEDFSE